MAKTKATSKKRNVRVDAIGQLHVHSSFNNIIVSLANSEGQVISWSSAGKMGFRSSKKNTPYAAQMAAKMHWDYRAKNFEEFPNNQKWFATGEALANLEHLRAIGKADYEFIDGIAFYRAI